MYLDSDEEDVKTTVLTRAAAKRSRFTNHSH